MNGIELLDCFTGTWLYFTSHFSIKMTNISEADWLSWFLSTNKYNTWDGVETVLWKSDVSSKVHGQNRNEMPKLLVFFSLFLKDGLGLSTGSIIGMSG